MTSFDRGSLARSQTKGPTLYFVAARPSETQKAIVAIVHGYAEHSARYEHVMRAWAERGIASVAIDLRGHGRSEGPRGACKHFSEYHDDVDELFALVQQRAGDAPILLFGHSFGGLVATSYTLAHQPHRALLLSAPYFKVGIPLPAAKVAAGKIVSRILPFVSLASGLSGKDVTHDLAKAKAYDEDPLVFPTANSRWFTECNAAQKHCLDHAQDLTMPLFMVLGTADKLVAPSGGREFFEHAGSKDKTKDEREGLYHEVLNEPEWPGIASKMADWILAH